MQTFKVIAAIFIVLTIKFTIAAGKNLDERFVEDESREGLSDAVSALAASAPSSTNVNSKRRDVPVGKCEAITVPMCRNMEYNMTSMPNQFNHYTQQEAAMEAHQFWALVEINCSKDLRFFLCSMYTPVCIPNYKPQIRACKSVCVRARLGCEKYVKNLGFDWPEHMNCDLFPEQGVSNEVCMDPIDASQQTTNKQLIINHNINNENMINDAVGSTTIQPRIYDNLNKPTYATIEEQLTDHLCTSPFIKLKNTNDKRYDKQTTGYLTNCLQPLSCKNSYYFNKWQEKFTYYWLMIWTLLCLISSLCTTFSYLIEPRRFKYPEKPIIYLSICYLFVSVGYLIRYIFVDNNETQSCSNVNLKFSCTITFILIYYFGMASSVWWVIVSLTWFLAAGLKWGAESISKYVKYFHMAAWLLPLIKTSIILSLSYVDTDALTGICYVGNLNTNNLRWFVLIPSIIYLTLGITFLIAGFISLIRIRNLIKKQNNGDLTKAHKLEKLMIRIGIFSILYTVPATCVMACQFYEQYYRSDWERSLMCNNFKLNSMIKDESALNLVKTFCYSQKTTSSMVPDFSIFMLKYFMSLIVGVTAGFWIWTGKTVKSWRLFFKRFTCCTNDMSDESSSPSEKSHYCQKKKFSIINKKANANSNNGKKESIVYFQPNVLINHELDENINHLFYDQSASSSQQQNQQQQARLLLSSNSNTNTNNSNEILPQTQISPIQYVNHYQQQQHHHPNEPVISLRFNSNNNTVTTTQQQSYPPYPQPQLHQHQQQPQQSVNYEQYQQFKSIQPSYNTNKLHGHYYDFCTSSLSANNMGRPQNINTTGTISSSSKYSIPSTTELVKP